MSEKNWTPGPWRWNGTPGESYLIAGDIPDFGCEADVAVMGYAPYEGLWFSGCIGKKGEDIANAVLVGVAPELYEALDAAMTFIESHVADPDITGEMVRNYAALLATSLRAVLAKARGAQ